MFRDTKKELERLERALLAEEDPEEREAAEEQDPQDEDWGDILLDDPDDFGEEHPGIYQNYSNGYGSHCRVYNSDKTDADPEQLGEAVQASEQSNTWLVVTACVLMLAIAGVLIFWVFRYFL